MKLFQAREREKKGGGGNSGRREERKSKDMEGAKSDCTSFYGLEQIYRLQIFLCCPNVH